jgi:hypothetical protein
MLGRIGVEPAFRQAAPGAPLVDKDRAKTRRIEQAVVVRLAAAARPAVQKKSRQAVRGTDLLHMEAVTVAHVQAARHGRRGDHLA